METEHPELKDKALKMMGPVLYYELSATTEPLDEQSASYAALWKLHEQVEAQVQNDLEGNKCLIEKIM